MAFSPDGTLLVTASLDHRARIWQVATGKTERVLTGHAGSVSSASFSADGRWVVTAGPRTGGIWPVVETDLDNDRLFFITDNQQRLTAATFAPTTSAPATWTIATAAANGDVATYTCALCAGTPELVHLAKQRNRAARGSLGPPGAVQGNHRFRIRQARTSVTVRSSLESKGACRHEGSCHRGHDHRRLAIPRSPPPRLHHRGGSPGYVALGPYFGAPFTLTGSCGNAYVVDTPVTRYRVFPQKTDGSYIVEQFFRSSGGL